MQYIWIKFLILITTIELLSSCNYAKVEVNRNSNTSLSKQEYINEQEAKADNNSTPGLSNANENSQQAISPAQSAEALAHTFDVNVSTVQDLEGNYVNLSALNPNKTVIIVNGNAWCEASVMQGASLADYISQSNIDLSNIIIIVLINGDKDEVNIYKQNMLAKVETVNKIKIEKIFAEGTAWIFNYQPSKAFYAKYFNNGITPNLLISNPKSSSVSNNSSIIWQGGPVGPEIFMKQELVSK